MIRHIVAIYSNNGIVEEVARPWQFPGDMAHFRTVTRLFGGNLLVGKKTFDTFTHPLEGRNTYVLTSQTVQPPGSTVVRNLESFLTSFTEDIWVIGGASLFDQTIALADELYITEIGGTGSADKYYPEYHQDFTLVSESELQNDSKMPYTFRVYRRSK